MVTNSLSYLHNIKPISLYITHVRVVNNPNIGHALFIYLIYYYMIIYTFVNINKLNKN